MRPELYQTVYLIVIAVLSAGLGLRRVASTGYTIQEENRSSLWPLLLCLVYAAWIGLRPVSYVFGDTINYAFEYQTMDARSVRVDWRYEWLWQWLMMGCKGAGLSQKAFFTLVAAVYVLSAFWAVKRLMPSDVLLGVLFVVSSLMFFTFSVNGLRNGLACHIVLLAICFLLDDKWIPGGLLCLAAFGIHRSTALPIAAALAGIFFIRDFRYILAFWVASIFISLFAGGAVTSFFSSLGFDDRMSNYTMAQDMSMFSQSGFRWDFLLYSTMPVVMAWYVCVRRGISDNWYDVICTVYCLCNAFWIMVIRSAFSNRFAYLSWFLYPIVIAYPLVNLPVWENQDRLTGWILLAYTGFTIFMLAFFWG